MNVKMLNSKNILVTGGLGYIGSHTLVKLIKRGYTPFVVDNLSNSSLDVIDKVKEITGEEVFFLEGDIGDIVGRKNIINIFTNYDIYAVIHFAAYKSVSESTREPLKYYDNNINSTIRLLELMKYHNVKNLIFSSSCVVYGQPDIYPVTEKTPIKPAESPYGETKRMCEQIIESCCKYEGINAISLRYFNPIGAHESGILYENPKGTPENLMPYITGVITGQYSSLKVFGDDYNTKDGTALRDYIDVNDLASAHVKALDIVDGIGYDVFNVGSGSGYTVMEVIDSFKRNGSPVKYEIVKRREGDIESIYGDISKAEKILNWFPEKSLDDSVNSILKTL
jgi:UDP-glucose 4-epimerase